MPRASTTGAEARSLTLQILVRLAVAVVVDPIAGFDPGFDAFDTQAPGAATAPLQPDLAGADVGAARLGDELVDAAVTIVVEIVAQLVGRTDRLLADAPLARGAHGETRLAQPERGAAWPADIFVDSTVAIVVFVVAQLLGRLGIDLADELAIEAQATAIGAVFEAQRAAWRADFGRVLIDEIVAIIIDAIADFFGWHAQRSVGRAGVAGLGVGLDASAVDAGERSVGARLLVEAFRLVSGQIDARGEARRDQASGAEEHSRRI